MIFNVATSSSPDFYLHLSILLVEMQKNIIASDKQLKPWIDWAYIKNLPLPPKPSLIEFYIVYISSFFKFPFGIIVQQLPFSKKVRYYEREMKLIFDKWNLEKIKKITKWFRCFKNLKVIETILITTKLSNYYYIGNNLLFQ